MITLSKSGGTVTFTFDGNSTYLQNGTIEVPLNSLSLIIDESGMATFRKSASNDIFISALYSEFGMSKAELEAWYKENMVGSAGIDSGAVQTQIDESISGKADTSALTVYFDDVEYDSSAKTINFYNDGVLKDSIDASDFVIDGMIDDVRIETISGASYLVIDFNTASGKEDIQIPLSDIFNPDNYYTKTATDALLNDYVTKASNVSSGYTSTLEINKHGMFETIDDVSDFYVSGNSQCQELYVEYGIENESCCYSVMFDFQNIPTFEQNYVVAEYDSTTRTYHIRNTSLDYPLFYNIRCSSYGGGWNADFKIWTYSIKIPSGQTADVLDNTIPYLLDEINAKPSTSDIPSMCDINATSRENLELAFRNSNYYNLFTSNLGVSNGIVASANTLSTEVVLDAEYKWMDCTINDGCESDHFMSESSAITFDMSRNPTDFISVKLANGTGLWVIGSNGENLSPQEFSVVIDNGHVAITSLRNYRIYGLMDNDCELDQYVSNLKYWGYETGTIQDAYDKLNGSLSGKVDTSAVTTSVTSASTDSEIPTAKAVFDAIPSGGGKAISAGTNISVTTGETADTINCTLPIRYGASNPNTQANLELLGSNNSYGNGAYGVIFGEYNTLKRHHSLVGGFSCSNDKGQSQALGLYVNVKNENEFGCGSFNNSVTASTTFGDSGNTLFSVGNGTASDARHNAFEIRQNGDIYITKDGQDVKLQDQLGGGGLDSDTERLLSTAINDLNDRKIDASEVRSLLSDYQKKGDYATKSELAAKANASEVMTLEKAKENELVTAVALNDLNERFGGLKLVKITESEYAALTTKDENTLYVVVADPS